jgi:hypothetical protein
MAAIILFYQVKFGLIAQGQISANAWALFCPYLLLAGAFVVFHLVLAPWRLGQESTQENDRLNKELAHDRTERHAAIGRAKECVEKTKVFLLAGFQLRDDAPIAIGETSKDSIEEWKDRTKRWREDTASFLETCSILAFCKFNNRPLGIEINSGPYYASVHRDAQSYFVYLSQRLELLSQIIEKPALYFK